MKLKCTIFLLAFAFSMAKPIVTKAQVNVQDSLALVALYNSTDGPNWKYHDNWLTSAPVKQWYGIHCGNRVTGILLSDNKLKGSLPQELGKVINFKELYLNDNQISGSLPVELGNLTTLFNLLLNNNQLTGSIPTELGNLPELNGLYLNNNQLSGNIPTELGNLTGGIFGLLQLSLDNNKLTGSIPPELGKLTGLNYLSLDNNQLTGSIPPELGNLTKLTYFYLNNNQLSGSIPAELGNFSSSFDLRQLRLDSNQLSGRIPKELGNLYLGFYGEGLLNLSNNQLSGSIPPELGNLKWLHTLDLGNNQLTGSIPQKLGNLINLTTLNLRFNKLRDSIPSGLGNLQNIVELNLSHNNLTGTIPASFNNLTNLTKLNLADNRLSGAVPSFLTTLSNLQRLYLLHNRFTFDGLETVVQHDYDTLKYDLQKKIHLHQTGNTLSVYAGGTLSNNTYKWFKDGALAATIAGDSTYQPTTAGAYTVQVTNAVATALTLHSDTVNYSAIKGLIASQTNDLITGDKNSRISVYPNPAKTNVTVVLNTTGNYTVKLTDLSGRVLQTKTGNAINGESTIQLMVAGYAKGVYLITVSNNKNQNQTFRISKE